MKRTAAVIVTYNRKAMLQRCLRACVPKRPVCRNCG